jgi:hypothetical protein
MNMEIDMDTNTPMHMHVDVEINIDMDMGTCGAKKKHFKPIFLKELPPKNCSVA